MMQCVLAGSCWCFNTKLMPPSSYSSVWVQISVFHSGEERGLGVSENKMSGRVFGPERRGNARNMKIINYSAGILFRYV
jgi:hypothetical protein